LYNKWKASITAEELASEIPYCPPEFIIDAFIKHLKETMDYILIDVRKAAKDDKKEVARILRAVFVEAYKSKDDDTPPHILKYAKYRHDVESTTVEFNLSFALWLCNRCMTELRDGNFEDAFHWLGQANMCKETAGGIDSADKFNERQKKIVYENIAAVRHAENRSMKDDAIQHYKDNHKSFTDKNDAAFQIAEKIVPAKFSTVRDWLKGVNPG